MGVARGKYRNTGQQDDYYLNDADLEGRYLDGLTFDEGPRRPETDETSEDAYEVEDEDAGLDEPGDPEEFEDVDAGGDTGTAGPKPSLRLRLAAAIAPKPPAPRAPRAPRTPAQRTPASRAGAGASAGDRPARPVRGAVVVPEGKTIEDLINNLDNRERIIALVAAVLGVAFAIFVLIYYAHPAPGTKNPIDSSLVASIIGVPALLTGVAVFIGRRALVGFMALLTGFAMLTFVGIAGVVYFGVGLWLIMKAQRYTRYAREQSGEVRPRRQPRERPDRGTTGRAAAQRPRTSTPTVKAPKPSKRYTPPRSSTPPSRRRTPSR